MSVRPTFSSGWAGLLAGVVLNLAAPAAFAAPKSEWESQAVLKDQKGWSWVLAFSPDGKTLATTCGGYDFQAKKKFPYSLRLWDVESQKLSGTLVEDGPQIMGMAFTSDGKQLVTVDFDGRFRRLDVASGKEVESVSIGERSASVWFSPDRKLVLVPAGKNTKPGERPPPVEYQLREVDTGKKVEPAKPFPGDPILALAPDAKSVVINVHLPPKPGVKLPPGVSVPAGRDEAHLWDAASGEKSAALTELSVGSALFTPDGRLVLLASYDGVAAKWALLFWDVADKKLRPARIPYTDQLRHFAFAYDGSLLAATCDDRTIRLWETTKMKEVALLKGHTSPAEAIVFSPDGKMLASAQADGAIRLWRRGSR
jgi:WD40 repeat protein